MRSALDDVVDRAVPPVDGAVVQTQLRELRGAPVGQFGHRVLVGHLRQQRREVAHVLFEQIEDRRDPAFTEPHAGADPLGLELIGSSVGGLGEQLDPGLGPQVVAEEERRVGPQRQLGPGQHLRGVPVVGEVGRGDLQV